MHVPSLLSGPIIRRVNPSQVYIWIATSTLFTIDADVYQITQAEKKSQNYTRMDTTTTTETLQLGRKLFAHLIKIKPKQGNFPTNELIGYNLYFKNQVTTYDLNSFGLLSPQNPQAIIYGDLKYPTFYINTQKNNSILYGSCRKPHGKGDDALVNADLVVSENYTNLEKRPSALFLMGDQIYADDVADPLSIFIQELAEELIGKEEALDKLDSRLEIDPFQTSIHQINGRQFIMNHFAKLTSNNASNHLIQFGEYAVMYLLSWGPQLWDIAKAYGVFDSFEDRIQRDEYYFIYPEESCFKEEHQKEYDQNRNRYIEQLRSIHQFQLSLFHVRRAIANTPTYMIFDDHDITDDWNISTDWKKNVWKSPLGRHVITNGLAAYWVFQGWGNDPESFSKDFKKTITDYFDTVQINSPEYKDLIKQLRDYDSWYFTTPTKPKAVFLDTRTMREFDPSPKPTTIGTLIEENIHSPKLISQTGWKKISHHLHKTDWQSGEPLIVVSPTPLYGIGLIESVLHDYVYPLRTLGISVETMLDFEAWKYNGEGFNEFHQWIAKWNPSHCIILSGDVHYASSVTSNVTFPNGKQTNIYQFTSSPMSNMSFYGIWGFLMKRVVGLNTSKRKQETIYRYCDGPCNLVIEDETNRCPSDYQWREEIHYLTTTQDSILELDNNIGLLSLYPDEVQNQLLKYYGFDIVEASYNKLPLE